MTGDVMRVTLTRRMEERAARRRAAIVDALEEQGVAATIEGEAVRASAPGLKVRWMADLSLREAGRSRA
ncbi:hypothetical protein CP98_05138 [Sphingobium yanoikuyae]|uniref:Uncharacterized protein n=1 Tax=Sphingobium yanoikuyae TaxID=13690 RepID=A0A084E2H8_SPHYA|nr:hypothetical protein [Sphingobium yanoikuyae]KEZ12170.1 hypothetical protein CP98_05138 [Sphingobium yanoikuyae]